MEPETTSVTSEREKSSEHQQALDLLLALIRKMAPGEGRTSTSIPFLSLIRHTHHIPPTPVVLTPAFCLILQGAKQLHLGQEILEAQAGDYLASMIALPAFAQITDATRSVPYFGLRLDFTIQEVASVVMEADIAVKPQEKKLNTGALIGRSDTDLLDICIRLLKLLNKPQEARFLSALLKREMLFHLLSGDGGHFFFQAALFDQQAGGIGKVIAWIREHYTRSFTIEEIAISHHMSISGLHHQFKAITSMGPLQYQKHLRLQEARHLMLSGSRDATAAALDVGYTSLSQFSRDYRRLFGLPPLQDIKAMRNHATAGAFEQREDVYGDQHE